MPWTPLDLAPVDGRRVRLRGVAGGAPPARDRPIVVLVHGWSGSAAYFWPAMRAARDDFPATIAFDLRGHGGSDRPGCGYTVARLAMDLREVLEQAAARTSPSGFALVGTSMGCAVIWSLLQLCGARWDVEGGREVNIIGAVLVDQAPLQNRRPDWDLGSLGCYDAASYEALAAAVRRDMSAFADGNAEACFHDLGVVHADVLAMVKSETLECCPEALCELMYDHTHQDWRSECRRMTIPALVMAGSETKIFPIDGIKAVAEMIPDSELKIFENCGHWLYLEEPKKFADEVHDFVMRCDDKQRVARSEGS